MGERKTEAKRDELPDIYARFKSEYLHALRRILDAARERQLYRSVGLIVEPAPDGGALIVATDGVAVGVFHDRDGCVNKPFRAMLPKRFLDRCAPPAPVEMFCEGSDERELPEWAQPGDVHLYPIAAMLCGRMPYPDVDDAEDGPILANVMIETGNHWREEDFRVDERPPVAWRRAFVRDNAPVDAATINLNPFVAEYFSPVMDLAQRRDCEGGIAAISRSAPIGEQRAFILQVSGLPEFVGAFMPMRPWAPPALPDFIISPAAAKVAAP
jgi:hypothetical protein